LNATPSDSCTSINWRRGLLLFLAVLALSLPQAALLPLLDRDEPRFAEASREMLQSGNFIVPTFNHAPRYAKPPLIYWCQAAAYTLFGENAFAARLPSLLATAATALLLFTWGTRLGSEQGPRRRDCIYAFCLQTVQQGRVATADALLIFFMTLTAFAGWLILHPRQPGRVRVICFVVLALGFAGGFLAKGPEALLPFCRCSSALVERAGNVMGKLIASFIAGLIIVLFWAIPAYIETNGDYWRVGMSEGVGERMVTGLQGHGASTFGWYLLSLPLYLLLFWLSALPWSPLLVIHRKKLFTAWKPDLADTYLLLNAGIIFVVFSLMVTKLPHYTLPAFPFLASRFLAPLAIHPASRKAPSPSSAGYRSSRLPCSPPSHSHRHCFRRHAFTRRRTRPRRWRQSLKPDTQFALVDFQEHFPMQKFWKRRVRMSSLSVSPMTSARSCRASRSSMLTISRPRDRAGRLQRAVERGGGACSVAFWRALIVSTVSVSSPHRRAARLRFSLELAEALRRFWR
jgi:hypothetical protein